MLDGSIVRAARAHLDITRGELAALSGVSPETIKNIESNVFESSKSLVPLLKVFADKGLVVNEEGVKKRTPCPQCGHAAET